MAYFPRYSTEPGFTPLFRLLDDFDNYARQGQPQNQQVSGGRNILQTFQPKFDVRELKDHFELHGELPGLTKDNVNIEFTDPSTLRIHGRVERNYTAGTPPAGLVQDKSMSGAITDSGSNGEKNSPSKEHQPTVEDDEKDVVSVSAPAPAAAAEGQKSDKKLQKAQKPHDEGKFWCSERTIGEFSRSFNFPGQIAQDDVSASLTDGILTVKIPKAPKHETRRIAIK